MAFPPILQMRSGRGVGREGRDLLSKNPGFSPDLPSSVGRSKKKAFAFAPSGYGVAHPVCHLDIEIRGYTTTPVSPPGYYVVGD